MIHARRKHKNESQLFSMSGRKECSRSRAPWFSLLSRCFAQFHNSNKSPTVTLAAHHKSETPGKRTIKQPEAQPRSSMTLSRRQIALQLVEVKHEPRSVMKCLLHHGEQNKHDSKGGPAMQRSVQGRSSLPPREGRFKLLSEEITTKNIPDPSDLKGPSTYT